MSFLRRAAIVVPLVILLGFASERSVPAGDANAWYLALTKPALTPPGRMFGAAWGALYVPMGVALAMILHARGAKRRWLAIMLFVVQLGLNLAWQPLFFGAHRVQAALFLIVAIEIAAIATTMAFARIRVAAAWLLVPYLIWVAFAGVLTWRIGQLNPDAQTLVPQARISQML